MILISIVLRHKFYKFECSVLDINSIKNTLNNILMLLTGHIILIVSPDLGPNIKLAPTFFSIHL